MHIEELNQEGEFEKGEEQLGIESAIVVSDAKRALVGAGARALFYPTLLYNLVRNKIQSEFRWWDRVTEFILLGAVPFPTDVPRLKELGVCGVVTLNESYETLVPTSLYHDHGIDHVVIPTRDYLFAPSYSDIRQAVNFIHENASCGKTTYVHCKAGRGRSTTIVICYLVEHKQMTPEDAYEYIRCIRPRVLLAPSQWQAVQEYYLYRVVMNEDSSSEVKSSVVGFPGKEDLVLSSSPALAFDDDDGSVVVVTESDLDGYYDDDDDDDEMMVAAAAAAEVSRLACRVQFVRQAAIARLSSFWLRPHAEADHKTSREKVIPSSSSCRRCTTSDQLGSIDIEVY